MQRMQRALSSFVDERVSVIPGVCSAPQWRRALLSCPWYRTRASSRGIPGKEAVVLSGERWSTKHGKPGQLAPRVHLRLIQCIIPTTPASFAAPSIPQIHIRCWLTEKRSPRNAHRSAPFDAGQFLPFRVSTFGI